MDYTYQIEAADITISNVLSNDYLASILAACPGSGKTTVSHIVINKYINMFPKARILVLTEGQSVLTSQYLSELESPNVPINFTYGPIGSDVQVEVGIPQGIKKCRHSEYDLLIVDEAHNYYLEQMVQGIVTDLKFKHKILMTGSPTKYNKHNADVMWDFSSNPKKPYGIHYIAAEDLIHRGIFSHVNMDVAKVPNRKDPVNAIDNLMVHARNQSYNLSKIMIACPNITYAKKVANRLTEVYGKRVSLSTSKNDVDGKEIERFKAGITNVLIVVGRGILGFNDKNMTALFDMRSSANLDASYQLFARVLRVHPNKVDKAYIRLSDASNYNDQVLTLHKIGALMDRETFMNFTGKNLKLEVC
jgi:superfamily II DNA or RNA helicase